MGHRTPGEGSIFQRRDGRWQASLQVHGVRKVAYGRTRQEAYRKLAELQRQASTTGALPNSSARTLGQALDQWLETAAPTLKPRTLADYKQTCRLYIRPALGKVRLSQLAPDMIQGLYSRLQTKGLARAAAKSHAVLHRALKLAVLWGWLSENPADRVLRPQYRPERKQMWSPAELRCFLAGTRDHWLYPAWVLLITSGCRIGELCALTWADVDWAGAIRVTKALQRINGEWVVTAPKSESGVRAVALPRGALDALLTQKEQQAGWQKSAGDGWKDAEGRVFTQWDGSPLHAATISHGLKRECRRLKILPLTPHGLRHLHASVLLNEGLPVPAVSARLGHANPGITMTVYAHLIGNRDDLGAQAIARAMDPTDEKDRPA